MKLFVTGAAGFIGSNFVRYWLKNHATDHILSFDLLTYAGNLENLAGLPDDRHTFVKGDIRDRDSVSKSMKGCDVVVHFAAESHVDRSILDPSPFVTTNVLGTQVLLDVAKEQGVSRFHHVSTDEVFGSLALSEKEIFSEKTPYNPRSPYSATKAASDHLVRSYFHTYGLPVTITNCSNNYGPYHFPEKFIPLAITNILEGKRIPVYGDGLYVRDWLYVEDHCRAIESVLTKGKIGDTYCVGGLTDDISNIAIIKKIVTLMNADESLIEYVKDRPGHDRRYAIDWKKIRDELDWKPLNNFDTWLLHTIDWYRTNTDWWQHIKSGEYQTYYSKQYTSS